MSIDEKTKDRLEWLLCNGERLQWGGECSPYRELFNVLDRVLKNNHIGSDRDALLMWTSGRVSEGYAHQLEAFYAGSASPYSSWETVGEIHAKLSEGKPGSDES